MVYCIEAILHRLHHLFRRYNNKYCIDFTIYLGDTIINIADFTIYLGDTIIILNRCSGRG
jgi:hypothetical protein